MDSFIKKLVKVYGLPEKGLRELWTTMNQCTYCFLDGKKKGSVCVKPRTSDSIYCIDHHIRCPILLQHGKDAGRVCDKTCLIDTDRCRTHQAIFPCQVANCTRVYKRSATGNGSEAKGNVGYCSVHEKEQAERTRQAQPRLSIRKYDLHYCIARTNIVIDVGTKRMKGFLDQYGAIVRERHPDMVALHQRHGIEFDAS